MNKMPRTPAFKKKVALEALREEKTIEEIAKEYSLNRVQVSQRTSEIPKNDLNLLRDAMYEFSFGKLRMK